MEEEFSVEYVYEFPITGIVPSRLYAKKSASETEFEMRIGDRTGNETVPLKGIQDIKFPDTGDVNTALSAANQYYYLDNSGLFYEYDLTVYSRPTLIEFSATMDYSSTGTAPRTLRTGFQMGSPSFRPTVPTTLESVAYTNLPCLITGRVFIYSSTRVVYSLTTQIGGILNQLNGVFTRQNTVTNPNRLIVVAAVSATVGNPNITSRSFVVKKY